MVTKQLGHIVTEGPLAGLPSRMVRVFEQRGLRSREAVRDYLATCRLYEPDKPWSWWFRGVGARCVATVEQWLED